MTSGSLEPPFLEVCVYDAESSEEELFQRVLGFLDGVGAEPSGVGLAQARVDPFIGPTDREQIEVTVDRLSKVDDVVDPSLRLVSVDVVGALRPDLGAIQRVTYLRVDPAHVDTDRHPVAIWSSGEVFGGPVKSRARSAGGAVRDFFVDLVAAVEPSYGAVTVDWPLGSPGEIAADPKAGWDYRDFFISGRYVGASGLGRIRQAARHLTTIENEEGLFVFSSEVFGGSGGDDVGAGEAFVRAIRGRARHPG